MSSLASVPYSLVVSYTVQSTVRPIKVICILRSHLQKTNLEVSLHYALKFQAVTLFLKKATFLVKVLYYFL